MKPVALSEEEWKTDCLAAEHICAACGEDLHVLEELVLVQIATPHRTGNSINFWAIENEGGFAYKPEYIHVGCWEEIDLNLARNIEDKDKVEDSRELLKCVTCESSIFEQETLGLVTVGEFRIARKMPNGKPALYFDHGASKPLPHCIYCVRTINHCSLELWDEVSHTGECMDGTRRRCWRYQACPYHCPYRAQAAE